MRRPALALAMACALSLFARTPSSGRSGPACDPAGADGQPLEAARAAVDVACPCAGFPSHARYERCVDETIAAEIRAGRLRPSCRGTAAKAAKRSSCSFRHEKVVCCEHTRKGRDVCTVKGAGKCVTKGRRTRTPCPGAAFCSAAACAPGSCAAVSTTTTTLPSCERGLLYSPEGNRLRRHDIDTIKDGPLVDDVLIPSASDSPSGRDINGQVCPFPDGSGRFITGEDTGQPSPPAGFGVFARDGTQIGKLTPTFQARGTPDPFGCGFDPEGRLFTSDIGTVGIGGGDSGQLVMWFPPFDRFPPGYPDTDTPSTGFCKIATDVSTAGGIAVDEQGRVYVTSSSGFRVLRFSPPFPTSPDAAGGCGATDAVGSPMADSVQRETFVFGGAVIPTPSGIARARNGNWFIASVLNGVIAEYTPDGEFVRRVLEPPAGETPPEISTGNPQGIAVDCEGDLYYADLNLVVQGDSIDAGPNGKVRWIHFDAAGNPEPPVIIKQNLAFPDSLGILPGDLERR